MASLNEQTEKSLYEKLQLPKFRSKEEIKEGLKSLAIGPVTGTLGLPSDILDLANLANDLSADYTGNVLAKAIQPKLNEIQEKYGRDAFDKGFTELTGIKSDSSDVNQMVGELVSLGGLAKAGISGVKTATKAVKDVAEQTKQAFQPQAVTPEGIAMPIPEQPKGGQVDEMIGGAKAIDELAKDPKYKDKIPMSPTVQKGLDVGMPMSMAKLVEYKDLESKHNKILDSFQKNPSKNIDSIKNMLTPVELAFLNQKQMGKDVNAFLEFGDPDVDNFDQQLTSLAKAFTASENKLPVQELILNNIDDVKVFLEQKRFAETGVYMGKTGEYLDEVGPNQIRFEIPDLDAELISDGLTTLKGINGNTLGNILSHDMLYSAYDKPIRVSTFALQKPMGSVYQPISEIPVVLSDSTEYASYIPQEDMIFINPNILDNPDDPFNNTFRESLLHEIQHAVQFREGFESGASIENYLPTHIKESSIGRKWQSAFNDTVTVKEADGTEVVHHVPFANSYKKVLEEDAIAQGDYGGIDEISDLGYLNEVIEKADKVAAKIDNYTKINEGSAGATLNFEKEWVNFEKKYRLSDNTEEHWNNMLDYIVDFAPDGDKISKLESDLIKISLQKRLYSKANYIAERNYFKTAGEIEAFTVEERDKFTRMLLEQGKTKKEVLEALGSISPNITAEMTSTIKALSDKGDISKEIQLPKATMPSPEEKIIYPSDFEEQPIGARSQDVLDELESIDAKFEEVGLKGNKMNRGGVPTMQKKNIESQQLELFGGMKDQGGTKDPVSGNDVPVGSTKKEVRDDIPAQLSEGEFVLPADVVRYHGLEKIMGLRDQAKQGLNKMEAMGQMGNSDEATLPDDTPFMAQAGGVAGVNVQDPAELTKKDSIFKTRNPYGQQPQMPPPFMPIIDPPTPPKVEAPEQTPRTFEDMMGGVGYGQLQQQVSKLYKNNKTGETRVIPFVNGKPIYPIPAGFVPIEEAGVAAPETGVDTAKVDTTKVTEDKDRDRQTASGATGSFNLGDIDFAGIGLGLINPLLGIGYQALKRQKGDTDLTTRPPEFGPPSARRSPTGYSALGNTMVTGQTGTNVGDKDINTGGTFNNSFAVDTTSSDLHTYGGAKRNEQGHTIYRTINEQVKSLKSAAKTGWFGGPLSAMEYQGLTDDAKKRYNMFTQEFKRLGGDIDSQIYGTIDENGNLVNSDNYNQYLNAIKNENIGGSGKAPAKEGDGYLVSNGKAYKGKYVRNKTTGDMQFEREGGGTIVAVTGPDGTAKVGDLTGSGLKTQDEMAANAEKAQQKRDAEAYQKQLEAKAEKAKEDRLAREAEKARKEAQRLAKEDLARKEAARQEAARKKEQERIRRQQQRDQDKADREARREAEKSKTGSFDRDFQRDSSGRKNFKKGGLMTKPTKKNMKRGGLASR